MKQLLPGSICDTLCRSFVDILVQNAARFPFKTAFTFLTNGEEAEERITYGELDTASRQIAARLRLSCNAGDTAVLSFEQGIDFIKTFCACLYAGIIAVPCVPPKSRRALERLGLVIKDAGARVILSHTLLQDKRHAAFFKEAGCELILTNEIDTAGPGLVNLPETEADTIAFIQYTSGSTGRPKGVVIDHENLLENVRLICSAFAQNSDSVIVSWLPFYHDMGLIGGILVPVFLGAHSVLMAPAHFMQKPLRWLQAISRYNATTSGGPNFGFRLCAGNIKEKEAAGLDLSSWRTAFVGAEPIRTHTLDSFTEKFRLNGFGENVFQPCYGMAEATLLIAAGKHGAPVRTAVRAGNDKREERVVCCGSYELFEIVIVDENNNVLPDRQVGEILVKGNSVARGYWNDPALSAQVFGAFTGDGRGPFLRTGDLGFVEEGSLFVTGRKKDIIIINGRNYYPQDIEAVLTDNIPALSADGCAACSVDDGRQEMLAIVAEVRSGTETEALLRKINELVYDEFTISPGRIALVRKGTIPRTTSGKIQRYACRKALLEGALDTVTDWPPKGLAEAHIIEETTFGDIGETIRKVLAGLAPGINIGWTDDIFSAGINSITLAQFSMCLNDAFDIEISLDYLFENPTISALAVHIAGLRQEDAAYTGRIMPVAPAPLYALSPTQEGIWFDQQIKPGNTGYNIPLCVALQEDADIDLINAAINELVEKYEILRTAFVVENARPVQVIETGVSMTCIKTDLSHLPPASVGAAADTFISNQAHIPFDLTAAPLFRYGLIKTGAQESRFFMITHHIIQDGTSLLQLVEEILARYTNKKQNRAIPDIQPALQYRDYAGWMNERMKLQAEARDYWIRQFSTGVHSFAPGNKKPAGQNVAKGATQLIDIEGALADAVKVFSRREHCTVYMTLLSTFALLMSRHTGRRNIIIGIPVSGRQQAALQQMPGVFINAIMLPLSITDTMSFTELVAIVKRDLLNGLKYQEYPLHKLAKDLNLKGQRPFTSVFFNGLGFINKATAVSAMEAFSGNYGLDINLDLNAYLFEHEDGMRIRLDYREALFRKEEIQALQREYMNILAGVLNDPTGKNGVQAAGNLIADEAFQFRVRHASGARAELPRESIIRRFERMAYTYADDIAVICRDEKITYGELDGCANALAMQLAEMGVRQGAFIPLLMTKSVALPLSILALMKLGAAFVPMDTGWPLNRIKILLDELSPPVVLTDAASADTAGVLNSFCVVPHLPGKIFPGPVHDVSPEDPIYGMYTSGTTGMPKCAVNLHKGILNRFAYMDKIYGCTPGDTILFTSRHIYDASVWQMLWPLINGARLVIPDDTYGLDLHEITGLIAEHNVTVTDFVPSVFSLFVDYIESGAVAARVKSLRQLLIGGEAMNAKTIKRFRKICPSVGITNTYGPTEASIGTIFYEVPQDIPDIIPIGRPIDNVVAVLLDENLQPVPDGAMGDLYLGGMCLGAGYLNDPGKTAAVFIKNPLPGIDSEYLYRTGDVACYLPSGDLQFAGRNDSQVKINGIRVECGEIESALLTHTVVSEAAVVCRQDNNGKNYLVGVLKLTAAEQLSSVHSYLKQLLPSHMIPRGYAVLNNFPRTLNGKADRKALADIPWQLPEEHSAIEVPRTPYEMVVAEIWKQVLDEAEVSLSEGFFEAGGDSLKLMQLLTQVHSRLGAEITLEEMYLRPTIQGIAQTIQLKYRDDSTDIIPVAIKDLYPLSHAQKRLWILAQFPEAATAYNMSAVLSVSGPLQPAVLRQCLVQVVNRHESLRTRFIVKDGVPYQQIVSPVTSFSLYEENHVDCDITATNMSVEAFINRPFLLQEASLVRAMLITTGPETYVLSLVMHHIISDGWSMNVLLKEILSCYGNHIQGSAPAGFDAPAIQYKDYAAWQEARLTAGEMNGHRQYWLQKLAGEIMPLSLPYDFPRPAIKTYNGDMASFALPEADIVALRNFCAARNATLSVGFMTIVKILLHRYSGQQDIIVGIPVAGRNHRQLDDQVGFFVNTLPIRDNIAPDDTFAGVFGSVRQNMLHAFEHQAYPFDTLVDKLALVRDASRNPLFDVMVALQDHSEEDALLSAAGTGLSVTRLVFPKNTCKFDLSWNFNVAGDQVTLHIEYNTDIFTRTTVERIAGHFCVLVKQLLQYPEKAVGTLEVMTADEKHRVLHTFNNTAAAYRQDATLIGLFEEQAEEKAGDVALVFEDRTFTWEQINALANRFGRYLKATYHIVPGDLVAIMLDRSEWMIIAMLAVMKAGGAYVPVDPSFPEERCSYILNDSKAKVVIDKLELEQFGQEGGRFSADNPERLSSPEDIAYVIYTSGSTGQPKGCILEHKGVINRIEWMWREYGFDNTDIILQKTNFTFDVSVWEIFMPLCWGAKMVLCEKDDAALPSRITALVEKNKVTCLHFVPGILNIFIEALDRDNDAVHQLKSLKRIITSGEALTADTAKKWYDKTGVSVFNLYGPTEASIDVTHYPVVHGDEIIPIGRPINNTGIYILDQNRQPVPVGFTGEIYIAGDGLARGYLNKPELTAERFVPDILNEQGRMYMTGDLGRWLPDGNIEYLGRRDAQLKLRGMRIEPAEIEQALMKHEHIRAAVVQAIPDKKGEKILVAWLMTGVALQPDTVRSFLAKYLPVYMIPAQYVLLDVLPLTSGGKIDRKALPLPDSANASLPGTYLAPRNETEERLEKIWCEVLKIEKAGMLDNFFSLGGHSLMVGQVISRIRDEFKAEVPFGALFNEPTIARLAGMIQSGQYRITDAPPQIKRIARPPAGM